MDSQQLFQHIFCGTFAFISKIKRVKVNWLRQYCELARTFTILFIYGAIYYDTIHSYIQYWDSFQITVNKTKTMGRAEAKGDSRLHEVYLMQFSSRWTYEALLWKKRFLPNDVRFI